MSLAAGRAYVRKKWIEGRRENERNLASSLLVYSALRPAVSMAKIPLNETKERSCSPYDVVAIVCVILVVPAVLFVVGYVWIYLTGLAPRPVKSFYAKMLRVVKNGDRWAWSYNRVKGTRCIIGTIPTRDIHLKELVTKEHVKFLVTLNERWELLERSPPLASGAPKSLDIETLHVPTPDYTPPSAKDIDRAVLWVSKKLENADPRASVYVHCNAGRGRSATLMLCLIMALTGRTCEDAFEFLMSARKVSSMRGCCGNIRTRHWYAAKAYEARLKEKNASRLVEVSGLGA